VHPTPLGVMSSIMLLFIVSKDFMKWVAKSYSYAMFWMENIIFILFFLAYELVLVPVVYVKTFINVLTCT
jgi:hypothetical protein